MMEDYFAELDPNPPLEDDDRYDGIDDETFGVTKDDLNDEWEQVHNQKLDIIENERFSKYGAHELPSFFADSSNANNELGSLEGDDKNKWNEDWSYQDSNTFSYQNDLNKSQEGFNRNLESGFNAKGNFPPQRGNQLPAFFNDSLEPEEFTSPHAAPLSASPLSAADLEAQMLRNQRARQQQSNFGNSQLPPGLTSSSGSLLQNQLPPGIKLSNQQPTQFSGMGPGPSFGNPAMQRDFNSPPTQSGPGAGYPSNYQQPNKPVHPSQNSPYPPSAPHFNSSATPIYANPSYPSDRPSQPYGGQGSAGYPPNIQQASSVGMNYGQTGSYNSIPPHSINPNSPNSHLIHPPNQNVPGLIPNSHLLNHSSSPSPSSSTQPYLISQNPNANMHQSVPPQYLQQSTPPNASPFLQGQGPPPQHQQPVPHQQHSQQPGPPLSQQQPKHSSPSSASNPSQSNFNSSNNIYTQNYENAHSGGERREYGGTSGSGYKNQNTSSSSVPVPNPQIFRKPWTEASSKMSAFEIESIIRMQEQQLQSSHPYVDDFYYQNFLKKSIETSVKAGKEVSNNTDIPLYSHTPLHESITIPFFNKYGFEMKGVLGKIPSHNTRAPRTLLHLNSTKSEQSQDSSLLLQIENAFDCLIDIEDIDHLLRNSNSYSEETILNFTTKRREIIQNLFKVVPLFILTEETAQPRHREDAICSWEEDEGLLKYINKNKGRKLIARMLPLLPSYYAHAIFLFFMRNFCLILGILDQSPDFSSKALLPAMKNVISNLFNIPQIIMCLQVLICFHKDDALYYILRTIEGASLLQTMFSQVTKLIFHCPPHLQSQLAAITRQWQYYSQIFYHKLVGHYDELFHYNGPNKKDHFEGVCIFLESLARHLPPVQRKSILSEIATRMESVLQVNRESIAVAHFLVATLMS